MADEDFVQQKVCKVTGKPYTITQGYKELLGKIGVPVPEICFQERARQLLSFRPSVGRWYKRKCDFSGETIITIYPENARFPVYKKKYFDGDGRTAPSQDVDRDLPFFAQLQALQEKTPRPHQLGEFNTNCEFCDDARNSKDCYLSLSMEKSEKLFYAYRNVNCDNCYDIVFCFDCQLSYSSTYCFNCYQVFRGLNCRACHDSYFIYDCQNCQDCFLCRNLRGQKYCILNKQYSKEEYEEKVKAYKLYSRAEVRKLKKYFAECLSTQAIHLNVLNYQVERCTGDFLDSCRECDNTFFVQESEVCYNSIRGLQNKYCTDCTGFLDMELCHMVNQSSYCYNLHFSSFCANCRDSEYLDSCQNCSDCFACIGLRQKKFCIFNKQYSEEEYVQTVARLKEKMKGEGVYGQFFPYSMMYTGFNTTLARFFVPLSKEDILSRRGCREEEEGVKIQGEHYDLPDSILDTPEDISSKVIICDKTGQKFNFVQQYVQFCHNQGIALPKETHLERLQENFIFCSSITPITIQDAEGKSLTHYYPAQLGFQKIVSKEVYDKLIY